MIRIAFLCIIQLGPIQNTEPLIVGGELAKIEYYSHSAYLSIETGFDHFSCGSSIINQNVILTAGHCLEDTNNHSRITVRAGNAHRLKGTLRLGVKTAVHPDYNPETIANDIGLVYLRTAFVFGKYIKRVILIKYPPQYNMASIAGWGFIDECGQVEADWLRCTEQSVWSRTDCIKVLGTIPVGTFCAGNISSSNYVSFGDSGSALVVDSKIQIGLVSFKWRTKSRSLSVYTDVPHFFEWIGKTTVNLICT